jgi:hypothetical protein
MPRGLLALVVAGFCSAVAQGQLAVNLKADQEVFLLYEPIPLRVSLRNQTGRTLPLAPDAAQPWLELIVVDETGRLVPAIGAAKLDEAVLVPAAETIARTIDPLPLFDLRRRGNFKIQARVTVAGNQFLSNPVAITILEGREVWKQVVGLPPNEKNEDQYRTYSLVAHRTTAADKLFVYVRDEPHQLVYGVLPLGQFLPVTPPEGRVDKEGHFHVLYHGAPRSFGYMEVDPQGGILKRMAFSDRLSKPRLVMDGGRVKVEGGEQTYPRPERILTEAELNPPPPPAPPVAPKKKSWFNFGSSRPRTNAPPSTSSDR